MPVVIDSFEVVPDTQPGGAASDAGAAGGARDGAEPPPAERALEVERVMAHELRRWARVRAH